MNPNTVGFLVLTVVCIAFFVIGFVFGVKSGRQDNAEISRLRRQIDLGEVSIEECEREIETRDQALLKLRRRLAECESVKTEVKP